MRNKSIEHKDWEKKKKKKKKKKKRTELKLR